MRIYLTLTAEDRAALESARTALPLTPGRAAWAVTAQGRTAFPGEDEEDLELIRTMVDRAVDSAFADVSGVIGHDEENGDELTTIAFPRIAGGKAFDIATPWFGELLEGIGQPPAQPRHPGRGGLVEQLLPNCLRSPGPRPAPPRSPDRAARRCRSPSSRRHP